MDSDAVLLQQGLDLMLFGMSTVFVFLALLVVATATMSRVILALQPEQSGPATPPAASLDKRHIAVISAAIVRHRAAHGRGGKAEP